MDQLLSTLLANGGAATAVALVLLLKVMLGDRRTDRRLSQYTRSLEDRLIVLEAWREAATSALVGAGIPLPTVVTIPTPHHSSDRTS